MKLILRTLPGLAACLFAATASLHAAPPAAPAAGGGTKVDEQLAKFDDAAINSQKAPDFTVKYTTEKKARPKDWLEIEFPVEFKAPKLTKDAKYLDEVTLKYYVFLSPKDEKKRKVLTAEVVYVNVPVDEKMHVVVYLSPATLVNLTDDKIVDKGMIRFWGVEAFHGGKLVGIKTSQADKQWWIAPSAPPIEANRLLPKNKTPFAPLFYDYYLEEKPAP